MKYDFVAIGDTATDAFIKLNEGVHVHEEMYGKQLCLKFGDKLEYDEIEVMHGVGNAGNASVCAARLGANSAISTNLGLDENGISAIEVWKKNGINTEFVSQHKEFSTHYHFVLRFGDERTILVRRNKWPYKLPNFTEAPSWIYFSSIGSHAIDYQHEVANFCKNNKVKLAFQPGTFQITLSSQGKMDDVFAASDLFFCNREEAIRILNLQETQTPDTLDKRDKEMISLLKGIQAKGVKTSLITNGPFGAYAMDTSDVLFVPMYPDPLPPVSRTGAGDAFSSTVTTLIAKGMSISEALIRGPINSMSVVQQVGSQTGLLKKENIETLLKNAPTEYCVRKIHAL